MSVMDRVKRLERDADQAAGCRGCGGAHYWFIEDDGLLPEWMNARGACRLCGSIPKLWHQDDWDQL